MDERDLSNQKEYKWELVNLQKAIGITKGYKAKKKMA